MSEFEIFFAILSVSLRPLRLSYGLTQRPLRYAEDAEKIDQFKSPPIGPIARLLLDNVFLQAGDETENLVLLFLRHFELIE